MDVGSLNRAGDPIAIVLILCTLAIIKYAYPVFASKEKLSLLVIILSLAAPFLWRHNGFQYINKIQVPNNYVRITDEDRTKIPRLGNGFIQIDSLNQLNWYYDFLEKNKLWDYDFLADTYLPNYILNVGIPGAGGQGEIGTDYKVAKLLFDAFKDKPFIGVKSSPYINYWLAFDKGVVQTPEGFWVSPELVKGKYNPEDLIRPVFRPRMGLYCVAFGRSMKSLRPIFESVKSIKNVEEFKLGMNGTDADYIYIEFETDAKIKNKYFEAWDFTQYGINFYYKHNGQWNGYALPYGDGRLLLPIGDDSRWLFEYIEEIAVELDKGFSPETKSKLKKLELLKLKRYR
jgi:hypothetical protein